MTQPNTDLDTIPELRAYPLMMTTADVAEVLNLRPVAVMRLLNRKALPGTKIGSQWRIRRSDVQRIILGESVVEEE
ncbi:helix-turn-helix domain-containing protein [Mobilicoccus caccae]|uniref:Helix-turn-helix domain-containing protein n=1 Tax=Mobilicoccus caccae TaxID=1859295 RepID=A0ABQ6IX01_9MICO|nr:helix-turn-helix domain-containing protein [Mobilicoccus caccae]GMA42399.1 hypothetical protein GCM10025883_44440 [Mobilicoccus caccae]GMA42474.1 hypothetical protein GCM10025883_45190 [Mobilicoccus caccae]